MPRLSFRSPLALLAIPVDPSTNIAGDHMLQKGQPTLMFGEGGLGKSFLWIQIPISQILGRPLFDHPDLVIHGPPLKWTIIQTENAIIRQQRDLQAMLQWIGPEAMAIVDRYLDIHTIETEEDGMVMLSEASVQKAIRERLNDTHSNAVVLDPLSDLLPGDLNMDGVMREGCRLISRICKSGDPTRLIVGLHHALTGKAGAIRTSGFNRSSFGRNSKMLHAWGRAVFNVSAGTVDNQSLVVACGKCSNGLPFDPFAITRNGEGYFKHDPDFDLMAWEKEMASDSNANEDTVKKAMDRVERYGKDYQTKADLAGFLAGQMACSRASGFRYVTAAISKHLWKPSK